MQRRICERMQEIKNISYEARLKALNLHSLERSRLRGNLMEVFKWHKDYNKEDISKALKINNQDRAKINGFTLERLRFRKNKMRRN